MQVTRPLSEFQRYKVSKHLCCHISQQRKGAHSRQSARAEHFDRKNMMTKGRDVGRDVLYCERRRKDTKIVSAANLSVVSGTQLMRWHVAQTWRVCG